MELLTVDQVSRELNVSSTCVYSLVQQGRLRSIRIGNGRGTIRIDRDDLIEFVDTRRSGGNQKDHTRRRRQRITTGGAFVHLDANRLRDAWKDGE